MMTRFAGVIWAGVAAVLMANSVLVAYVFLAMLEDSDSYNNTNNSGKYVVFEDRDVMAGEFVKEKIQ